MGGARLGEAGGVARPPGAEALSPVRGQWQGGGTAESSRVLVPLLGRGVLGLGAGTLAASFIWSLLWCSRQSPRRGCRNTKASMFAGLRFQQVCKEAWAWGLQPRGSRQLSWGWPRVPHRRRGGSGCWTLNSGLGGRTRSTCLRLIHQSKGAAEGREVQGRPGDCPRTRAPPGGCPVLSRT